MTDLQRPKIFWIARAGKQLGILILFLLFSFHLVNASEKPLVVIMLGAPGCGKGTQSQQISQKLNVPKVDVGEILRRAIREESNLGKEIQHYVESGELVPTPIVLEVIFNRIDRPDCQHGFVIDGSSRTLELAEALCSHIENNFETTAVLIDLSDEVILSRIEGRLVCTFCGASFHEVYVPSKIPAICDFCGKTLSKRSDDQLDVFRLRLANYRSVAPFVNQYYFDKHNLIMVSGLPDKDAINQEIFTQIQSRS